MTFLSVKNRALSILASSITLDALELAVKAGEGSKFPASNFHITIQDEIILCTSRATDTFTIVRAKEDTTAAAHAAGKSVELRITAAIIKEIQDSISPEYKLEDLSDQCDGTNKVFSIDFEINEIIWLSLGGGLLIAGLDYNKTGDQEITLIGKYDTSPPELGEKMYIYYIKNV